MEMMVRAETCTRSASCCCVSPAATRSVYFSANSAVNGTVCLAGASICSGLIEAIDRGSLPFGINSLFLVGAALMVATILSVWRLPQSKPGR